MPGFPYYAGRFLQLFAMSLLLMSIMTAGHWDPARVCSAPVSPRSWWDG